MKVKAIRKGHYGQEIKLPGEVFTLIPYKGTKVTVDPKTGIETVKKDHTFSAEEQFSDKWMEKCEKDVEPRAHQHGAPKGDGVEVQKFNPATSDNAKSLDQIKAEHGPRGGDKSKGDVI